MARFEIWFGLQVINFILILCFIPYVVSKMKKSKVIRWILGCVGILFELGMFLFTLFFDMFVPRSDAHSYLTFFWVIQSGLICLYHIHKTGWIRVATGAFVLIGLGIYMYYNGSVQSQSYIWSSFNYVSDYGLYQLSTYLSDVIIPFSIIYNLIIAPFWLRKTNFLMKSKIDVIAANN